MNPEAAPFKSDRSERPDLTETLATQEPLHVHETQAVLEALPSLEERRAAVIEKAHKERMGILRGSLTRIAGYVDEKIPSVVKKTAGTVLESTIVGNVKRGKVAVTGEDFSGEAVSNQERVLSGITVGCSLVFYAMMGYGYVEGDNAAMKAAAIPWGVSTATLAAQMSPKIMATLKTLAEAGNLPKVVKFLESAESVFERVGYERVKNITQEMTEAYA